jgi:uncharacterized protein YcaQ
MSQDSFSRSEARRVALAAQGFDKSRPNGPITVRHLSRLIRQLGLIQLDFVNVLIPAHYQVLFSRLGPYPLSHLDEVVYRRREFTEQWAHEASLVPVSTWPLLRHRMTVHRVRPYGFEKFLEQNADYVNAVLDEVRTRGPLTAEDLSWPDGASRRLPGAWVTAPRAVLEAHFGRGLLAVAERRSNFARVYDLVERVLPPEHHNCLVDREEAQRELLRQAARAHGLGTAADLADYFRMPVREARPRLQELVDAGELRLVRVEDWRECAYLHSQAKVPPQMDAAALLSPFDPVVWFRPRTARLFDFDYRFEIFVPQAKRRWGTYVLPFLRGDRLVARVDLKTDRTAEKLLVPAAYLEPQCQPAPTAQALAAELRTLANWLELESIEVGSRGNLARPLSLAVRELIRP